MPMYSLYAMPTKTPQLAARPLLGRDGWCSGAEAAAGKGALSIADWRGLRVVREDAAAPQITSCDGPEWMLQEAPLCVLHQERPGCSSYP